MLRVVKNSKYSVTVCLVVGMIISLMLSSLSVFAVTEEQAMNNLTTYVYGKMSQEEYPLEEGGSVTGSDLFEGKPTEGYDLNEDVFGSLSGKGQSSVVEDIATYSNEAVESDKVKGVEKSTVTSWWKNLQSKKGVGSKFMNEILKDTKPDFVTAHQIFEPFSSPISILMGVIAVAIMSLLGLVIVSDIAYIVIPPVRLLVDAGNKENRKGTKSLIFSHAAVNAVEQAEGGQGGERKQALGMYFKSRVVELILLGICLLYLVNGQIYTLVGYILDIVSGFLGF